MEPALLVPTGSNKIQPPASGAGFWIRAGARIIDLIAHNLVWLVAALLTGVFIGIIAAITGADVSEMLARVESTSALGFVLALVGSILYHAACEYIHGATLGKFILGLHVKDELGNPISLKAALVRSGAYVVDALLFGAVAYNSMQKSPLRQRLGDTWAKTVVVERSKLAKHQIPPWWKFLLAFAVAATLDAFVAVLSIVLDLL